MLDYIYGQADDDDSTALGARILEATREAQAPRAVRHRKDRLAAAIDAAAERVAGPRVLAVACGHLREGHASSALQGRRGGELVAFDQDQKSLAVVDREFSRLGGRTVHGRVRDLIVGRHAAGLDRLHRGRPALDQAWPAGRLGAGYPPVSPWHGRSVVRVSFRAKRSTNSLRPGKNLLPYRRQVLGRRFGSACVSSLHASRSPQFDASNRLE